MNQCKPGEPRFRWYLPALIAAHTDQERRDVFRQYFLANAAFHRRGNPLTRSPTLGTIYENFEASLDKLIDAAMCVPRESLEKFVKENPESHIPWISLRWLQTPIEITLSEINNQG